MKTRKYDQDSIGWLNPWKAYKNGLIPLGLAEAYEKKWGYNPLKTARLHYWIHWLRSLAWQLLGYGIILVLLRVIIPAEAFIQGRQVYLDLFGYCLVIPATLLAITWKINRTLERRICQIQSSFKWFMKRFQNVFETKTASAFQTMESLQLAVTDRMTAAAKLVLEHEIALGNAAGPRWSLEQLSEAANNVGLGKVWNIYFDEARKTFDTYACFAWEI